MEKKPSQLEALLDQMPTHLSMEDLEQADVLLMKIHQRLGAYNFQTMALYLRKFVHETPAPGMEFELSVDREDGTYFLYIGGTDGIELDPAGFDSEEDEDAFREAQNERLQAFAQEINDSPWREDGDTIELIERLNEVAWAREEMDAVIAEVMDGNGYDGKGFVAALHAHEIAGATPQAKGKRRRNGL